MKNRTKNQNLKKIYLKKLSVEMIKRGVSNKRIKSVLDEVSVSLDEFIIEFQLTDYTELVNKFGTPASFCEGNSISASREAAIGQVFYLIMSTLSFLAVVVIPFISILYPQHPAGFHFASLRLQLGIFGANEGYGALGVLFGLNIYLWINYQYFKNRFSPYDIRIWFLRIILFLYWFLVVLCYSMVTYSYIVNAENLSNMWNQSMKFLVLEGVVRWIALGGVLSITAVLFTIKYMKQIHKRRNNEENKYWIDKTGALVTIFALTGFISAGPGLGLVILAVGFCIIFLKRMTGKTLFLGIFALLLQLSACIIDIISIVVEKHTPIFFDYRIRIIFGIRILDAGNFVFAASIISFCLLIIWITMGVRFLKKNKLQVLPKLSLPKNKTTIASFTLVVISLIAVLGSQPQQTRLASDGDFEDRPLYWEFDTYYKIPGKGSIYISVYTHIEETSYATYLNGTTELHEIIHLLGDWFITWTPTSVGFWTFRVDGDFSDKNAPFVHIYSRYGLKYNISVLYLTLNVNESGIIHYSSNILKENFTRMLPSFQIQWSSMGPWFPTWIDLVIFVCSVVFLFLTWDRKKLETSILKEKGDT